MMKTTTPFRFDPAPLHSRQRGAAAIIVAVSLAMLIGFAGLVLDLGHLYVTKTELQNAADACALAAANELVCDPAAGACPAAFLHNAEAAGIFVAGRNNGDFQGDAVVIDASDVKFSTTLGPNVNYLSRLGGANPDSKFAMCTARAASIRTWFIHVINDVTTMSTGATAVATLAPGQSACTSSPIGVCAKDLAAPYGYAVGEWIVSSFNSGGGGDDSGLDGNFRWVDFTPSGGGTDEVRDQLLGRGAVCNVRVGDDVREEGVKQGAKSAWNTRFGIYPNGANAESPATAAPDKTGYAYPSKGAGAITIGNSAYADYRARQALNSPFDKSSYDGTAANGNNAITSAEHLTYGGERRIVAVPVIECGKTSTKILAMGCALMLNPMPNGNTGDMYVEWRGRADVAGSPCRSAGVAGGTNGPLVPTLVQ